MANRINEHISNTQSRVRISPSKFESGMIIDAFYKNKLGDTQRCFFLVLHPKWPKTQKQVHALKLNEIPKFQFLKLIEKFGLVCVDNVQRVKIIQADIDESSSKKTYITEIKQSPKAFIRNSYRTLRWEGFQNAYVVNYKFGKKLETMYPCSEPPEVETKSNETDEDKLRNTSM